MSESNLDKEREEEIHEAAEDIVEVAREAEGAYGSFLVNYLKLFSKRFAECFLVYMVGFWNISFGWLMAPLFFMVLREKRAKAKQMNFDIVRSIVNSDEKDFIQAIQKYTSLPSWVTFPDMERVEWVNQIMVKLWPYAGQYCEDLCKDMIEPAIAEALKAYNIGSFRFDKIILGDTPPRFGGIKVYKDTSRHEIILDTDMVYAGDCKFEVGISKFKAGIKDLQIAGRVRVVMKPLVRQIPLVGGLQVFFLNNPDVDFNLIGIADVFDMPGISDILRSIVIEQIAALMVLPNRFPIQLVQDINMVELKCPAPAGVLRIQVIEAQNLMKKDIGLLGTGKSDPYCVLRLGAQKFQTKTINNTVNPKWNFCAEFLLEVLHMQTVEFELFDLDDGLKSDEKLGRASLDVQSIWKAGEVDMWVPLSAAKSGRIHVKATWLELSEQEANLHEQLAEIRVLQANTKNPLHSAVLMVWVDSAKKLNQIPDPYVRLRVGNSTEETSARLRTNDPVFEEGFTFLVRSPLTQELTLEILDQKTGGLQGKLEFDLNKLLQKKNMEMKNVMFSLSGAQGGMAEVKLTLTLRILAKGAPRDGSADSAQATPTKRQGSVKAPSKAPAKDPAAAPVTKQSQDVKDGEEKLVEKVEVKEPPKEVDAATGSIERQVEEAIAEPVALVQESVKNVSSAVGSMTPFAPSQLRQRPTGLKGGEYGLGRIQLTVKFGPRNTLVVVVHKIENLPKEEDGEIPDPYVKLYLLPDRSKDSKRKTDVIKDSCDPVFDERFDYSLSANELTQRTLEVSVVNKKGLFHLQRSSTMGQVVIDCGLLNPQDLTNWYDLQPAMDEGED